MAKPHIVGEEYLYDNEIPAHQNESTSPRKDSRRGTAVSDRISDHRNRSPNDRMSGVSCYNCGEDGHMSRDCPNERKARRHSDRDSDDRRGPVTCYNCGEEGHMSRECPNER